MFVHLKFKFKVARMRIRIPARALWLSKKRAKIWVGRIESGERRAKRVAKCTYTSKPKRSLSARGENL